MARINQRAMEKFMRITGVSEATAMQKLEKCGDVIDALIEHFNEGDRNVAGEVRETTIDVTDGNQNTPQDEQTNKISSDTSLCGTARDEQMTPFRTLNELPRLLSQDIDLAMSLSIETAEQEGAQRLQGDVSAPNVGPPESSGVELGKIAASNGRLELLEVAGRSFLQDLAKIADDIETGTMSSSGYRDSKNNPQHNRNSILEEELGGISSEERDDALMLEAIMLGGIPEGNGYSLPNDFMQNRASYPLPAPRPPSPSLSAQRLVREQQDDECLKSLQADIEKALRAVEEAKAALEEEWRRDEESQKKLREEKCLELERRMAAKEAALPPEPSSEDENAVTLLVKMPDGRCRGRRFLKSDNLQYLFDFIDTSWMVKPGTYRFVRRSYPRRVFSDGEGAFTLNEVGVTNKQEVLYLELI
ncbi:hypothetical protein QN277_028248 [Acacia crassicarpa]|uniref:UBX domain-containing protein n=1 Tax=Acacia crassicarpa TaxID=499986 RepID=A0AAE1J2P4_9FABA|nr:hypothetical protein QN277_028248 [Acacia crassicarpa]